MKSTLFSSLLVSASKARGMYTLFINEQDWAMDVKHWVWADNVNIESTLSMQRGSWMVNYDQPIIEQTILITDTKIPEEELATLNQ